MNSSMVSHFFSLTQVRSIRETIAKPPPKPVAPMIAKVVNISRRETCDFLFMSKFIAGTIHPGKEKGFQNPIIIIV
jgi:hypothetical protein